VKIHLPQRFLDQQRDVVDVFWARCTYSANFEAKVPDIDAVPSVQITDTVGGGVKF
jgi:hypothetical protein